PAAVRPEQAQNRAGRDLEADVAEDVPVSSARAQLVDGDSHRLIPSRSARSRRNNHRKNGAPTSAVSTPRGTSAGAASVRASRSQVVRNTAPPRTATGSILR